MPSLQTHTKDETMYGLFFLLLGYCMPHGTGAHCLLIDQNWHTNNLNYFSFDGISWHCHDSSINLKL
jgi:hypothetical protein